MDKKTILWIDEEQMALDSYFEFLEECFGEQTTLIAEMPLSEIGEMLDRILSQKNLAGLVLDQRLKSSGIATYTGIELAEAIRRTDSKLPVYILTNHADDIGDLDYQVEYVLQKDYLHEATYQRMVASRVRRHMDVFGDIVSQREIRFEELLRKSLAAELSEEEKSEFDELDFWRSKATLAQEEGWAEKLKDDLDQQQNLLDQIKDEINAVKKGEG